MCLRFHPFDRHLQRHAELVRLAAAVASSLALVCSRKTQQKRTRTKKSLSKSVRSQNFLLVALLESSFHTLLQSHIDIFLKNESFLLSMSATGIRFSSAYTEKNITFLVIFEMRSKKLWLESMYLKLPNGKSRFSVICLRKKGMFVFKNPSDAHLKEVSTCASPYV